MFCVLTQPLGQAGLDLAARLNQLGVSNLVVDRNARVGDNWRSRYKSLVLHDPIQICHMPYLHFPPSWPLFTPKDKLADWFEAYASLMDLNIWMSTSVRSARWSDDTRTWTVQLRKADGTTRVLKPTHFVLATGHSGEAHMPRFDGLETFGGTVYHTSLHQDAADFGDLTGKKVVVVGSGNSGHDIAQDYHEKGAEVTMVQRGATVVVSVDKGVMPTFKGTYEDGGPPLEDADIHQFSYPWKLKFTLDGVHTSAWRKEEAPLLDGLTAAGFALRYGEASEGLYKQYITVGGGYYIDVGASQLIADGKIKVKRDEGGVKSFNRDSVVLAGGEKVKADIVVLATGFENMRTTARKLVGDRVADRLKDVWGLDEEGEMNAVSPPSQASLTSSQHNKPLLMTTDECRCGGTAGTRTSSTWAVTSCSVDSTVDSWRCRSRRSRRASMSVRSGRPALGRLVGKGSTRIKMEDFINHVPGIQISN